jgi:hypothetical protein
MNKFLDIVLTAFAFWSLIGIILFMGVVLQSLQQEDRYIDMDKITTNNGGKNEQHRK